MDLKDVAKIVVSKKDILLKEQYQLKFCCDRVEVVDTIASPPTIVLSLKLDTFLEQLDASYQIHDLINEELI